MVFEPIGIVHSPFVEPSGAPIQSAVAEGAEGWVEVFGPYLPGLKDLDGFDRIWLIYRFHQAAPPRLTVTPFLDTVERGLFATRAPCRPNPIGMSPVRLLAVEGSVLRIADVDVVDGTPLLDIKPYAPRFDHFEVNRTGWLATGRDRRVADDRFSDNAG